MEQIEQAFQNIQTTCSRLHPIKLICTNITCKDPALSCLSPKCQPCNDSHPGCVTKGYQSLLRTVLAKRQPTTPEILTAIQAMEKIYDDAIERISIDKEFMVSQMEFLGFNQKEAEFLRMIRDGTANQMTGELVGQLCKRMKNQSLWVATEEDLIKYWKRRELEFMDVFDRLKTFPIRGIPKLDSLITDDGETLQDFFGDEQIKSIKLLYRARDHQFSVKEFHKKCNYIPNTLIIAKTQYGNVIGGYTPLQWTNDNGYSADQDEKTFIFSLTHRERYNLIKNKCAINGGESKGPTFGAGPDFMICNLSHITADGCSFRFPSSYGQKMFVPDKRKMLNKRILQKKLEKNRADTGFPSLCGRVDGIQNARVVEWEVHQIEFT